MAQVASVVLLALGLLVLSAPLIYAQALPEPVCEYGVTAAGVKIPKSEGGCCSGMECCQYLVWQNTPYCIAAANGGKAPEPKIVASIKEVTGTFQIVHADGSVATAGTTTLSEGDAIVTKDGTATLALEDGRTIYLYKNTKCTLESGDETIRGDARIQYPDGHIIKTGQGTLLTLMGDVSADLLQGKTYVALSRMKTWFKGFEIRTGQSTCSIRGTELVLEEKGNKTTMYLHEGIVDVTPEKDGIGKTNETKTFEGGSMVVIDENGIMNVASLSEQEWASQTAEFGNITGSGEPVVPENITTQTTPDNQTLQGHTNPQIPEPSGAMCPAFILALGTIFLSACCRRIR